MMLNSFQNNQIDQPSHRFSNNLNHSSYNQLFYQPNQTIVKVGNTSTLSSSLSSSQSSSEKLKPFSISLDKNLRQVRQPEVLNRSYSVRNNTTLNSTKSSSNLSPKKSPMANLVNKNSTHFSRTKRRVPHAHIADKLNVLTQEYMQAIDNCERQYNNPNSYQINECNKERCQSFMKTSCKVLENYLKPLCYLHLYRKWCKKFYAPDNPQIKKMETADNNINVMSAYGRAYKIKRNNK